MTKVLFHGSIQGFRGRIGNMIFRQLPDGTTIVTEAPPKKNSRQKKRAKEKRSPAQKAHNNRFQEATFYARWAARTRPIYAELAVAAPMKTAYNFALSDWFKPPKVERIERKEGCIRVKARDNIRVNRVKVTILDSEGCELAAGEAVREEGDWWVFVSPALGKMVIAEAWDLPGNSARLVLE